MDIDILFVPVYEGCNIKGVEQAPKALFEAGAIDLFKRHHNVTVLDEVEFGKTNNEDIFGASKSIKFKDLIFKLNTNICSEVCRSISLGHFPITFGGDHSLGVGTIAGNSKAHDGSISVIWFDAHPDINTPETSPSMNFHGMSFGAAMGYGDKDIIDIGFKGAKVQINDCYLVGIRSVDQGEQEMIDNKNIFNLTSDQINFMGINSAVDVIIADIQSKKMESIHLSIDVDVVAPEDIIAVNVPEKNGIAIDDVLVIVRRIVELPNLKAIDFVEYNPLLDSDGKSLANCLRILEIISETLAKKIK